MKPSIYFIMIVSLTLTAMALQSCNNDKNVFQKQDTSYHKSKLPKSTGKLINTHHAASEVRATTSNKSGYQKEIETPISYSNMPQPAKKYVDENYPNFEVRATSKVIEKNKITYEVELKQDDESFELVVDIDGRFLGKEPDDDYD